MPQATSLAAEIKQKLGVTVELISGNGGVFDVVVDQEVIYSKQSSGNKFPEFDALIEQLEEKRLS